MVSFKNIKIEPEWKIELGAVIVFMVEDNENMIRLKF